jgi:hypothetical protein
MTDNDNSNGDDNAGDNVINERDMEMIRVRGMSLLIIMAMIIIITMTMLMILVTQNQDHSGHVTGYSHSNTNGLAVHINAVNYF